MMQNARTQEVSFSRNATLLCFLQAASGAPCAMPRLTFAGLPATTVKGGTSYGVVSPVSDKVAVSARLT